MEGAEEPPKLSIQQSPFRQANSLPAAFQPLPNYRLFLAQP